MEKKYRIFFAIPFDSVLMEAYHRISEDINEQYPKLLFPPYIGNKEVGPSPKYSKIATFKAQNRELTNQFVAQIQRSDIVIADLTYNNPNAHVELGIAITHNKNILRVTGRPLTELGFDIQGLEAYKYNNEEELKKKIVEYLETFFMIKQLSISSERGNLYWKQSKKTELRPVPPRGQENCFKCEPIRPDNYVMRDGAVRVKFRFRGRPKGHDRWFGVFLRAGVSPWMGSHLVFVRPNGAIQLAINPGSRILKQESTGKRIKGEQTLLIEFDNNQLSVELGGFSLQTDKLVHQAPGRVLVAAWNTDADVYSVDMICRDTIDWS